MNSPAPQSIHGELPRNAEEWVARLLSPDCTSHDHGAFEDWLAASPGNPVAYAHAEQLHAMAHVAAQDIEPLPRRSIAAATSTQNMRRRRLPSIALAATLLAAIGLAAWIRPWQDATDASMYTTAIGEQHSVTLPDGTSLVLDTDTRVTVSYQATRRRVELEQGRLHADVAHDPSRPFEVVSGLGVTRALGTVFQVEEIQGTTFIRLIDGRVAIDTSRDDASDTLELQALQSVSYAADGTLSRPIGLDPETAKGWLRGKLVFKDRALPDLLSEFNRYSTDKITVADNSLGDIRISGVFDAKDQAGLIASLQKGWGIRAKRTSENEILLFHGAE